MPNYSFATLTGHAAKDADLRFSAEGKAFTNLLVAVNRKYGNKETVTWWKVLVFGKPAEWAGEIKKGDVVQASGEPYMEEWIDKEGNKRYTLTLAAMTVINHSYKKEKVEKQAPSYNDMPDSDIPFMQPFHGGLWRSV